jgi:mannose-6-phosphate isomerase-like protein (cupin superfamily)
MLIRSLDTIKSFIAGDGCVLKEYFNPSTDPLVSGLRYSLAHASVAPGTKTKRHTLTYSEVYCILKGTALMHIDSESREVTDGDVIYIPPGSTQFIECEEGGVEFLCIVDPAWTPSCERIIE